MQGRREVEVAVRGDDLLGESPVWCSRTRSLYWVDIKRRVIRRHRADCGETTSWPLADEVCSLALREAGGAVIALRRELALFDFESGEVSALVAGAIEQSPGIRFNDGRCDRAGRFWVGGLVEQGDSGQASLWRLDADRLLARMLDGVTIANGIAWSVDDQIMYFADSWERTIYAFDFDRSRGEIANRRVFARWSEADGEPDGATVDADGCLWVAHWDGWRISRYSVDGRLVDSITVPVPRPTSLAFGGDDLSTLFVTSASTGLGPEALARAPLSGSVFAVRPGVAGLPEPRWAG